jgi:hypothetical protein
MHGRCSQVADPLARPSAIVSIRNREPAAAMGRRRATVSMMLAVATQAAVVER